MSLRYAARSLRNVIVRSHASMWRWAQRLGPVLGSFGADPRDVHRIFVDETMVDLGGTSALIWIAFEPDLRAMLDFHVSWRGNSIDAYLFIRRLVRRYGRVPIYTDGAGWWAGAGRARGERSSACITGCQRSCSCTTSCSRTGTWGGPARVEGGGDAPVAERATPDTLARVGGGLKVTEPKGQGKSLKPGRQYFLTMLSSGQLSGHEEREPISPAIPGEGIYEVKYTNRRTNVVRLLPNGFQERKLKKLANTSAKLFKEVNYERRQQFFRGEKVGFKGTWDRYYEKYREELGVNAQAVMQKNNEAWNSFFSLLKLKKEGKLPPHMKRVSPPKYWKDRETKKRKPLLVVRQDRYVVDERNHKLILRDFDLEVEFVGRLKWYGKQGRLEIHYDETRNAWHASIPVEVGVEETKTGKKSKYIVHGERKTIQVESPRGNKVASIDLGINVLASVVLNDGTCCSTRVSGLRRTTSTSRRG